MSTHLEEEDGSLVYEVSVKDKAGVVTEVIVDAGNAKIMASEVAGNEAAEGTESSNDSEQGSTTGGNEVQDTSPGATSGK